MQKLLYILTFKNKNSHLLKIGITRNLKNRINSIENSTGFKVSYPNVYVLNNVKNSTVSLIERNLLNITSKFSVNWSDCTKFAGMYEFRSLAESVPIINKFLEDQENYGITYDWFHGVDICGQYTHTLPKIYFPINTITKGISPILEMDVERYCSKKKIKYYDFINLAIFNALKMKNAAREDIKIKNYENYFKI